MRVLLHPVAVDGVSVVWWLLPENETRPIELFSPEFIHRSDRNVRMIGYRPKDTFDSLQISPGKERPDDRQQRLNIINRSSIILAALSCDFCPNDTRNSLINDVKLT